MAGARGQVVDGRYRLDKQIAQGGMGSVWLARHLELDVDMAVKLIREEFLDNKTARARFRREARAAAKLRSPNICRVHDFGVFEGQPFLVMELLDGEDVAERLDDRRGTIASTKHIIDGVVAALEVSHAAGIVHRDLKPSNIFLARTGSAEQVKVLDFGIAKAPVADSDHDEPRPETTGNKVIGSPPYMSPEQARGDAVDHRTDLWSLAVIAYELLTDSRPFNGPVARMFSDIVIGRFKPVCEHNDTLPESLDAFFTRALAPEVDKRFPDAAEFGKAFDEATRGIVPLETAHTAAVPAASVPATAVPAASVPATAVPATAVPAAAQPQRGRDADTKTRTPAGDTRAPTTAHVSTAQPRDDRWRIAVALVLAMGGTAWWLLRTPSIDSPASIGIPTPSAAASAVPTDNTTPTFSSSPTVFSRPTPPPTPTTMPTFAPSAARSAAPIPVGPPRTAPPRLGPPRPAPPGPSPTSVQTSSPKTDPFSGLPISP